MSKISLKTDYEDGQVLYSDELNVNNNVVMLGVNDNHNQIINLGRSKADIVYVDNSVSDKVDTATLNTRIRELDLAKADKTALATKAERSEVELKANKVDVNNSLAEKADITYVDNINANKINKTEFNDALALKANSSDVGDLSKLNTSSKNSLVDAINSVNRETIPIATVDNVGMVKPDGTTVTIDQDGTIHAVGGGESGGTTDYDALYNKPTINEVEIKGALTIDDLSLMSKDDINKALLIKANKDDVYTKEEIDTDLKLPLLSKADKVYVDNGLALKADVENVYDKATIDELINGVNDSVESKLTSKANISDVYTKIESNNLLSKKADNLIFNNDQLQLTSNGELIGDPVTLEVGTNDIRIQKEQPTDNDWKIWIDSDEVQNLGSEVVNTLEGNEINKAPSVQIINETLDNINNYYEEEHIIGKWIDKKPLYRKVLFLKDKSLISKTELSLGTIPNIENVVKCDCNVQFKANSAWAPIPFSGLSSNDFNIHSLQLQYVVINPINGEIIVVPQFGTSTNQTQELSKIILVVEYTKTTDQEV